MTRVLLGQFGAVVKLGLEDLFATEDLDVKTAPAAMTEMLDAVAEDAPDVVLLDLDSQGVPRVVGEIARRFPQVKVVACSSTEPSMRVYPAYRQNEFYESPLSPQSLVMALKSPN